MTDSQTPKRPGLLFLGVALMAVLGIVATVFLAAPNQSQMAASQFAQVGKIAPDFELPSCDGSAVKLSSLRGHEVLLVFYRIHT